MKKFTLCLGACLLSFVSFCSAQNWSDPALKSYWSQGKGEITTYALTQSRYGELHRGSAVLIFVTEPFSRSKQVKLDDWKAAGDDLVQVLKVNFTENFLTGIYPYSLMFSAFTPVDASPTLKTSASAQEWCGHVFGQLNRREDHLELVNYSYFEADGDTKTQLPAAFLEDEIWTRIRLAPDKLPTGDFAIIPGSFISRLLHVPLKSEKARASFVDGKTADIRGYKLEYLTGYQRTLTVWFEKKIPHAITSWEDTYSEFGKPPLTSHAERTDSLMIDYWNHHDNAGRILRKQLGLSTDH